MICVNDRFVVKKEFVYDEDSGTSLLFRCGEKGTVTSIVIERANSVIAGEQP